jgi:hypothetical protein
VVVKDALNDAPPKIYSEIVLVVVRHVLTVISGTLLSHGLATKDQQTALIDLSAGIATGLVVMAWSAWQKWQAKRVLMIAAALAKISEAAAVETAKSGDWYSSVLTPPKVVPVAIIPEKEE